MRFSALGWLYISSVVALFIISYPYRDLPARWVEQATSANPLARAKTWRYQPGASDVADLAADPSDVLVVGSAKADGSALTPDDVARIKRGAQGRDRVVLAYFSVAEPSGLDGNCKSPRALRGNFTDEGWKATSFLAPDSYLRRVIAAGFDGVYLADLDAYQDLKSEQPSPFWDVIAYVRELAATARRLKSGFLIVPENGEALLAVPDYRRVIDAVGGNGLLYGAAGRRNDDQNTRWSMPHLDKARAEGKPVFVVEHLTDAAKIDATALALRRDGFVPTFDGGDQAVPDRPSDETNAIAKPAKPCSADPLPRRQ